MNEYEIIIEWSSGRNPLHIFVWADTKHDAYRLALDKVNGSKKKGRVESLPFNTRIIQKNDDFIPGDFDRWTKKKG